ncbi:MAG: membrane protein [Betaproteobacteria bacterium ADurb.Bin341]|nr:MAG: membrane protein [Betaproteobacteria bacterium ADurb.Bin341]
MAGGLVGRSRKVAEKAGMKSSRFGLVAFWACLPDALVCLCSAGLLASTLGIRFLNSVHWPTGGDTASHLLYAKLYAEEFLFSGQILPWMPEVFGGLPFLSYYFPLPFIVIAFLSKLIGFAPAFKWGTFLAALLLPGAVFSASRRWLGFSWPAALFAAMGAIAFLLHEQNSIWGGNLLSTLAGEFSYSYGLLFAMLSLLAWVRAIHFGRGWLLAALLEAACGFSHGFPLLLVGFSTPFLLLDGLFSGTRQERIARFSRSLGMLLRGHLLAFALLGGWLWPMLEMHPFTIPNDASFPVSGWRDLFPASLWPVAAAGILGIVLLLSPRVRRAWERKHVVALCFLANAAGLSAVAFVGGDRLGLADIRFFPPVWLLGAIACGWLFGQGLDTLLGGGRCRLPLALGVAAACLGLTGWLSGQINKVPDWGLWNHSGLQAKPQWHNLSQLFPAMHGQLWSPRLLFEHDPANRDLGSTRSLEALPMFLGKRPVLEGLYMESALLGPAVYQVQSEVSARPSSPLARFPSGSLDPEFAARHMNFLHADSLLLRSDKAKTAIEASGRFERVAESRPFALYRVKGFDSRLAEVVRLPLRFRPKRDWMQDAYAWFRLRSRFDAYLPVYVDDPAPLAAAANETGAVPAVVEKSMQRHQLVFETEAIGRAHLIKMAYHPRWRLETRGSLHLAGPGFMLVVPQEKEIRLVYGSTWLGQLGIVATALSALLALFLGLRPSASAPQPPEQAPDRRSLLPLVLGGALLVLAGGLLVWRSPERAYKEAWEAFNAGRFHEAAGCFERAYDLRRPPAKKEEALFWLAKSMERAGKMNEAKQRYRALFEQFHGYWLPESVYTYIQLERRDGRSSEAEPFVRWLREEHPHNSWTQKLRDDPTN